MSKSDTSPGMTLKSGPLWFYGLPGLALAMPTIPAFVHLPSFYAVDLGLGLTIVALCIFAARLFDVVTDPLIGRLSDRCRSRFGRRRPFILSGGILAGIALIFLFSPPADVGWGYLLGWSLLLYLGWTLVNVPYTAWGAELTGDYRLRSRITAVREALMLVGIVIAGGIPAAGTAMGLEQAEGYAAIAWVAVGLGVVTFALLLTRVPDHLTAIPGTDRNADETVPPTPRFRFKDLRVIGRNLPFMRLFSAWVLNGMAVGIPSTLFPIYLQFSLQASEQEKNLLILVYFLAGVLFIPVWLKLSDWIGKHRCWCIAMAMAVVAFVWVPLLGPGDIWAFTVVCIVTGLALGADLALPPAMQADVIDLDRLRTGERREGLFFAFWGTGQKLSLAMAAGGSLLLLSAVGFDADQAKAALDSGEAIQGATAIPLIYALIPAVFKVGAITLVWNHPIDAHRHGVIRRRLDQLAARA